MTSSAIRQKENTMTVTATRMKHIRALEDSEVVASGTLPPVLRIFSIPSSAGAFPEGEVRSPMPRGVERICAMTWKYPWKKRSGERILL